MTIAKIGRITVNKSTREIYVSIDAKGSRYIEEPTENGFPYFINGAPLVEGFNYVLEFGHVAVNAMKGNSEFNELAEENRKLKMHITSSELATRCKQFLSSLDYASLSDYQAKCALLLEKELK